MKSIHPQPIQAATLLAVSWFAIAAGCRNQPTGLPNPFLAPDRVPPPATRSLLPGQAQPYYPGDPLPVMQSATTPSAAPAANNQSVNAPQLTGTDGLNWNAPATGAAGSAVPLASAAALSANATPSRSNVLSNEPAVAIPSDGETLRFPLTPPEALTSAPAPSSQQPVPTSAAPPLPSAVIPAAFTTPVADQPSAANVPQTGGLAAAANGPWQSPQIAPPTAATSVGATVVAPAAAAVGAPGSMDVRLRAVPSPPAVEATTPRIRLPGYVAPQPMPGASAFPQPGTNYATAVPTGPMLQTVQISPLPSPPVSEASSLAAGSATVSGDGFRPRTSMR
jgi:hypothetical protein